MNEQKKLIRFTKEVSQKVAEVTTLKKQALHPPIGWGGGCGWVDPGALRGERGVEGDQMIHTWSPLEMP